jgi:protein NUD1
MLILGLSSLVHLRELRVESNKLTSLDGILQLDGLLKVSAKNNEISGLDFTGSKLGRLEVLACERNCIGWVEGLEELVNLMSLHLGMTISSRSNVR